MLMLFNPEVARVAPLANPEDMVVRMAKMAEGPRPAVPALSPSRHAERRGLERACPHGKGSAGRQKAWAKEAGSTSAEEGGLQRSAVLATCSAQLCAVNTLVNGEIGVVIEGGRPRGAPPAVAGVTVLRDECRDKAVGELGGARAPDFRRGMPQGPCVFSQSMGIPCGVNLVNARCEASGLQLQIL